MKGFSLVEVLIAISIMVVIGALGIVSLVSYGRKENLEMTTAKIQALLEEARSLTLSSRNDMQYGVHLNNHEAVLFQGAIYAISSESNQSFVFSDSVNVSSDFVGGGVDVLFDRLRGTTDNYGTTTITSSLGISKEIIIHKTGLIERE
ncbi:MAG: prepilin-type N-terminal cleavage/methylation domain-containing protein [Candidatus Taylorbacteria bacterium]|nr:prepilin-type N-terminal cleavage/methylation domain-containing protein [Candidatus Taylorbacteria bacterium]